MAPRITLLTDFGTADGYVAAMKGVMAGLVPAAAFDDAGHDVPRGDVLRTAWALGRYWNRYPPGTVHLVVVDPGVGTERRALAVEADGRFVVAPDNGAVSRVLDAARKWRAVELGGDLLPAERSATFHGRDVFAPAAARLAGGAELEVLGPTVSDPVRWTEAEPEREGRRIRGEVVVTDRFGNLVTNVPSSVLRPDSVVLVRERELPLRATYGSVEPGELLALVNSSDRLEVAVRDGSAARRLDAGPGTEVAVTLSSDSASGGLTS